MARVTKTIKQLKSYWVLNILFKDRADQNYAIDYLVSEEQAKQLRCKLNTWSDVDLIKLKSTLIPPNNKDETLTQEAFFKWCELLDYSVLRYGRNGWPDAIVYCPGGKNALIELKSHKGTLGKHQKPRKKELEKLQHTYHVCRSVNAAKMIILDLLF